MVTCHDGVEAKSRKEQLDCTLKDVVEDVCRDDVATVEQLGRP